MIQQRAISILVAAVMMAVASVAAAAERVGYQFIGSIEPSFGSTVTLFGVELQLPASISGTFSYDMLSQAGTPNSAGAVPYKQSIDAGFTLNIYGDILRLSADHFKVQVTNDYQRTMPVETVDIVDVIFDNTDPLTAGPINVNDQPWTGTAHNFVVLELSYPPETFANASLPAVLPDSFAMGLYSLVGSSSSPPDPPSPPQRFEITSLLPTSASAGEYNVNGQLDASDYIEWRKAFGCTDAACLYADGNGDGVVDGADYVIFRHAMATTGSGSTFAVGAVSEPAGMVLAWVPFVALLSSRRNGFHHRRRM